MSLNSSVFRKILSLSDKITLELLPNRRVYVRWPLKTGLEENYLSKTTKFGGKKLMMWGFITYDGRKGLEKITGKVNSKFHIQILQEILLPIMNLGEILQ